MPQKSLQYSLQAYQLSSKAAERSIGGDIGCVHPNLLEFDF